MSYASTFQFHTLPRFSLTNPEYITPQTNILKRSTPPITPTKTPTIDQSTNFSISWGPFTASQAQRIETKIKTLTKAHFNFHSYPLQLWGVFSAFKKNQEQTKNIIQQQQSFAALHYVPNEGWGALYFTSDDPTLNEQKAITIAQQFHLKKISVIRLDFYQKFFFIFPNISPNDLSIIQSQQQYYPTSMIQYESP